VQDYSTTTFVFESLDNLKLLPVFLGIIWNKKLVFVQIPFSLLLQKICFILNNVNLDMQARHEKCYGNFEHTVLIFFRGFLSML